MSRANSKLSASVCELALLNRQRAKRINLRKLREITEAALEELGISGWKLAFHFVGAKRMAQINKSHLNHDGPTDVITFDYADCPRPQTPDPRPELHGEIFICVAVAVTQAREFGTTWQSEIVRYIVHALLHLCGYDDLNPKARREMKQHENRLVRKLSGEFRFASL